MLVPRLLLSLSALLIGMSALVAEDLSPKRQAEAAKLLRSMDGDQRRQAFQALWQLGDEAEETMKTLLAEAEAFHEKQFSIGIEATAKRVGPFEKAYEDWQTHLAQTLSFGRQDLGTDHSAFKELDSMMVRARRLYRELANKAGRMTGPWTELEDRGRVLQELRLEAAMLGGAQDPEPVSLSTLYGEHVYGEPVLTTQVHWQEFKKQHEQDQAARAFNAKETRWPSRHQRAFAEILAEDRQVLGLPVAYLHPQLSMACEGHSMEMRQLGYFSHDSPTPERATPWKRAALAGYQEQALGENIFAGDSSPEAAYQAWWRSDGHRKLLLNAKGNHLGIALVGKHWTMMMGLGGVPPMAK